MDTTKKKPGESQEENGPDAGSWRRGTHGPLMLATWLAGLCLALTECDGGHLRRLLQPLRVEQTLAEGFIRVAGRVRLVPALDGGDETHA